MIAGCINSVFNVTGIGKEIKVEGVVKGVEFFEGQKFDFVNSGFIQLPFDVRFKNNEVTAANQGWILDEESKCMQLSKRYVIGRSCV